jgi:hypothetical protein
MRRTQSEQAGEMMTNVLAGELGGAPYRYLADWTDRIAKGELPHAKPPRPSGVGRNIVVTTWDWSDDKHYLHDLIATKESAASPSPDSPAFPRRCEKIAVTEGTPQGGPQPQLRFRRQQDGCLPALRGLPTLKAEPEKERLVVVEVRLVQSRRAGRGRAKDHRWIRYLRERGRFNISPTPTV